MIARSNVLARGRLDVEVCAIGMIRYHPFDGPIHKGGHGCLVDPLLGPRRAEGKDNTHVVRVEADESSFEVTVRGVPSEENPATGKLTPLSALATLRGLVATMRVGT